MLVWQRSNQLFGVLDIRFCVGLRRFLGSIAVLVVVFCAIHAPGSLRTVCCVRCWHGIDYTLRNGSAARCLFLEGMVACTERVSYRLYDAQKSSTVLLRTLEEFPAPASLGSQYGD